MDLSGKKVIVIGALGMLAGEVLSHLMREGCEIHLMDLKEGEKDGLTVFGLNISDLSAVKNAIGEVHPDWIINCAAYTGVDDAESHQEVAFSVNAIGPANLAKAAKENLSKLVHISTDYVFGGSGNNNSEKRFYTEEDTPCPCGIYGQSKRFGDELVMSILPGNYLIARTSWLHGIHGHNIINTLLNIAENKSQIKMVNDQIGSPTWCNWLVSVLIKLIKKDARGIFNATSRGNISWFELAKEVYKEAGIDMEVLPQTTMELGRPAPRPAFSTLDVSKLENFLGQKCISWREGIRAHLEAMDVLKDEAR